MYSVILMMALSGGATETPTGAYKHDAGYTCNGWADGHGCGGQHTACYGYALNCRAVYNNCFGSYPTYWATPVSPYFYLPPAPPKTENKPPVTPKPGTDAAKAAPAEIVVSLPADARLSADGQPTNLVTPVRRFFTPALTAGREYVYTFKMDVMRNGREVSEAKRVVVRAGETTRVEFAEPADIVAKRD